MDGFNGIFYTGCLETQQMMWDELIDGKNCK